MKVLNKKTEGTKLFEIVFTPKGSKEKTSLFVYAKNRLDASNYLILNHIYGKQHLVIDAWFGNQSWRSYEEPEQEEQF